MNICPACNTEVEWQCGRKTCKCYNPTKNILIYEKIDMDVLLRDGHSVELLKCPICGFAKKFSWWEQQNIKIIIAIQLAEASGSFTKAVELREQRKKKYGKQKTDS